MIEIVIVTGYPENREKKRERAETHDQQHTREIGQPIITSQEYKDAQYQHGAQNEMESSGLKASGSPSKREKCRHDKTGIFREKKTSQIQS